MKSSDKHYKQRITSLCHCLVISH